MKTVACFISLIQEKLWKTLHLIRQINKKVIKITARTMDRKVMGLKETKKGENEEEKNK